MFQTRLPKYILNSFNKRYISEFLNVNSEIKHFKTPLPKKFQNFPLPLYGGKYTVTILTGNGVGTELSDIIQDVAKTTCSSINFEEILQNNLPIDEEIHWVQSSIRRNRVGLKCCVEANDSDKRSQHNIHIRAELDIYIAIIHCKAYPNVKCIHPNTDIVIARQTTEGEYLMLEHETVKGNVEALKVVTRESTIKYANWALDYARVHNRKKISIVHQRDVYAEADGLFVDTIKMQAENFKDLKIEVIRFSPFIEKLMKEPTYFDFVMLPNLYGSVTTNILCALLGGSGLFSKKCYSDHYAVFEPAIATIPKGLKGTDTINPVASLNTLRDMLSYLRMDENASKIDSAIHKTLCEEKIQTSDLGGRASTSEFIDRVKFYIGKCY